MVPSAIDAPAVDTDRPADPEPSGALRIGIVGRIAPWKGQDLFLQAFAQAFPHDRHRAVVIGAPLFGEDEFADRLKALAGDLGVAGRVEFRGFRSDIGHELARLHILVHASRTAEPFGLAVVEGMAAGLAVVAADAGGPAEVITPGVDGVLYRLGDVGALAGSMRDLARSAELRSALGARARRTAEAYRSDVVAAQMEGIYDRLC